MKICEELWHAVRMQLSASYRNEFHATAAIEELKQEISRCAHSDANLWRIAVLERGIKLLSPARWREALKLLADANNFDCKGYAVAADPALGWYCADQLMETAREHLRLSGHLDRAMWARKRLLLAREWYQAANALTAELEREINEGLEKTAWAEHGIAH